MTVRDLIEKLKSYDPEILVITRGMDEFGFADIEAINLVKIKDVESESTRQAFGEYEEDATNGKLAVLVDHF